MYTYMALAVFFSFCIKGISGFANSLIFGTVMSYRTDTVNITPLDLILNLPANLILVWQKRKDIIIKSVLPISALMLLGSLPGVFWLSIGDASTLKIMFGVLIISLALEMVLREKTNKTGKPSRTFLIVIGLLSGICAGMFGVSAILAAYLTRTTRNIDEFKGTLCAVFAIDNVFRLCLYMASGILTIETFQSAITLSPFMLLGMGTGIFTAKYIPEKIVKNSVCVLLFLSGVSLILSNI